MQLTRRIQKSKKIKENSEKQIILGDDAVESPDTDWLNFNTPASKLAKQLFEVSKSSGVCCGIVGSWGSGKSSFMKLMENFVKNEYHDKVCVAWFTAWDPGGIEDLGDAMLYHFAHCIAREGDNKEISKAVKELDEALGLRRSGKTRARQVLNVLSKLSPEGGRQILKSAGAALEELDTPREVQQSFDKIVKWLKDNDRTAFFFIDDLDRSIGEQIFNLLSELKVYVSHPRIVAVLAYDEEYVLNALKTSLPPGIDPNKYLEKIVTIRKVLPVATAEHLQLIASSILRSALKIEGNESAMLGGFATEFALRNPRRLKRLLLTYLSAIPKTLEREGKERIRAFRLSALIICAAAEMGLLKHKSLLDAIEGGSEEEILSCLKNIGEKELSEKQNADALATAVTYIEPDFRSGLITSLRFASYVEETAETPEKAEEKPSRDWKTTVGPVLIRAIHAGFQLNSKLALLSHDLVFSQQGKIVDVQKFARSVTRDKRTQRALSRFVGFPAELVTTFAYQSAESNILIAIGAFLRLGGVHMHPRPQWNMTQS